MIAHDGLASVACESRPARVLTGVAIIMDLLVCYLFLTEVGAIRLIGACFNALTKAPPCTAFS